jgi:hypothetical protein
MQSNWPREAYSTAFLVPWIVTKRSIGDVMLVWY